MSALPALRPSSSSASSQAAPSVPLTTKAQVRDAIFDEDETIRKTAEGHTGLWLKDRGISDSELVREAVWASIEKALEWHEPFNDTEHLERWITQDARWWILDKWKVEGIAPEVPLSSVTFENETTDRAADRLSRSTKYSRAQLQMLLKDTMIGPLDDVWREELGIKEYFIKEQLIPIHLHEGPPRSAWAKRAKLPRLQWVAEEELAEQLEKAVPDPIIRAALEEHVTTGTEYAALYARHAKGKTFGKRGSVSEESFFRLLKAAKRRLKELLPEKVAKAGSSPHRLDTHTVRQLPYYQVGSNTMAARADKWEAFKAPGVCKRTGLDGCCACGNARTWTEIGPKVEKEVKNRAIEHELDRNEDWRMRVDREDFDMEGYKERAA